MMSMPRINPLLTFLRKVLAATRGHRRGRLYGKVVTVLIYCDRPQGAEVQQAVDSQHRETRSARGISGRRALQAALRPVGSADVPDPRQRLLRARSATAASEVVTDQIDHIDADGSCWASGDRIDADVIITATGIQLQALGGVALSIDGAEVKPQDRFVYKEHLLEDVPNTAWCVGYINASWTLRADLTARAVAKLLAYMDSHGYTHAYPHLGDVPMPEKPAWNINAGYMQRAAHALPKSGTHRPWNVRHNYVLDVDRSPLRPDRGVDGVRPRRGQVGAVGLGPHGDGCGHRRDRGVLRRHGGLRARRTRGIDPPVRRHAGVADLAVGGAGGLRGLRAGGRGGALATRPSAAANCRRAS